MSNETPEQRLNRIFHLQKEAFLCNPYPSAEQRIELMQRVPGMMRQHRERILAALDADFGGHSREQGDLVEIIGMFDRAKFNIDHVRQWMKPVRKAANPITMGKSKAYIRYQPKGVIGNMVSWNFPFDIGIGPMLDALGAGNRVIIKPSDMSLTCGQVLQEMIAETFDEDQVAVVNGDLELAKYFPTLPWDHLIYTGSGAVGREIMKAAAVNLVPVTLELGGKCPVIVGADKVTDPATIATIGGIKAIKRGQMCVSVDYCLVPESGLQAFTQALTDFMQQNFSAQNGAAHSCGIISERHLKRLNHLVAEARDAGAQVIQIGTDLKPGERHMPFYLVVNPAEDLSVMREEIFGPIIPIKTYQTTQDAIRFVTKGDRPLGLYVFSDNAQFINEITRNTHSGGVAINAVAAQAAQPSLAFGGVGASGMGRHHGEEGFRELSNPRGYFVRRPGGVLNWITPPYGADTRHLIEDAAYAGLGKQAVFALKMLAKNLFVNKLN